MRTHPALFLGFFLTLLAANAAAAPAPADCRDVSAAMEALAHAREPEARTKAGACLVRHQLDRPEVAKQVLRILRDPSEDLLLREDLIEAFAESPLRRKVRIEMPKAAPQLGRQEKDALDHTLAGANNLMAVTQAMASMEDTAPVTIYEGEFFRVLNDIAIDDQNHVLLRAAAVAALEKVSAKVADSGVYDEKTLRQTRDTLRSVAAQGDEASYHTEASQAYTRLVSAGVPGFTREGGPARMISSVKPAAATVTK